MTDKFIPLAPSLIGAFVIGFASCAISVLILFVALPVVGWLNDTPLPIPVRDILELIWQQERALVHGLPSPTVINALGIGKELAWRWDTLITATVAAVIISGMYLWLTERPIPSARHLRGLRVREGDDAVNHATSVEADSIARSGQGLWLAPGVPMSRERETLQFAVMGSVGAGKTQVFLFFIEQLLERDDKMIVHDAKGDFVSGWPDDHFILLSPTDQRTWAWDIASDVHNTQRARELAARLIPKAENAPPMWSQGSRAILTGLIVRLQTMKPSEWSWHDLLESAFLSPSDMKIALEMYYPIAAQFVCVDPETGEPNATSYGFFIGAQAPLAELIGSLSAAWRDVPPTHRVSLAKWMLDDDDRRTLIIQSSSEYPSLSSAWIGAALDTIASLASSNRLSESRSRRIWLLLDEFAQVGVGNDFQQTLLVGRSRGVCSVLGLQDPYQLSQKFDEETRKIFLTVIGTTIIGKFNPGDSAKYVCETLFGDVEVEKVETSVAYSSGSGGGKTTTVTMRQDTRPAVLPSELRRLGSRQVYRFFGKPRTEIEAIGLGYDDILKLRWPLTVWPERRPGNVAAAWLGSASAKAPAAVE